MDPPISQLGCENPYFQITLFFLDLALSKWLSGDLVSGKLQMNFPVPSTVRESITHPPKELVAYVCHLFLTLRQQLLVTHAQSFRQEMLQQFPDNIFLSAALKSPYRRRKCYLNLLIALCMGHNSEHTVAHAYLQILKGMNIQVSLFGMVLFH